MSTIQRDRRRHRQAGRAALTRAEQTAEARRTRAQSHLQRVRGQRPARKPRRTIFAVAMALAVGAGTIYGSSLARSANWVSEGNLESIFVRGAGRLSAADIATATGVSRSADLASIETEAVVEHLESHAWIAGARALRLPTGGLLIEVTESVPVAVVDAGAPARTYVVDAAGTPFAEAAAEHVGSLLRVSVAGDVAPFETNERVAGALELANDLPRYGIAQPVEIRVAAPGDGEGYSIRLAGLQVRVLLGREDFDSKLRELARFLASDVPGIEDATELDLRFAGQAVLRSEPPRSGAKQAAAKRGRAAPST